MKYFIAAFLILVGQTFAQGSGRALFRDESLRRTSSSSATLDRDGNLSSVLTLEAVTATIDVLTSSQPAISVETDVVVNNTLTLDGAVTSSQPAISVTTNLAVMGALELYDTTPLDTPKIQLFWVNGDSFGGILPQLDWITGDPISSGAAAFLGEYSKLGIGGRGSFQPALQVNTRTVFTESLTLGRPDLAGPFDSGNVTIANKTVGGFPGIDNGLEMVGIILPGYRAPFNRLDASIGHPTAFDVSTSSPGTMARVLASKFSAHDSEDVRIGPQTDDGASIKDVLIEDESETARIAVRGGSGNVEIQDMVYPTSGVLQTTNPVATVIKTYATTLDRAYLVKARIIGRQSSGLPDSAAFDIVAHVENVAGNTVIVSQSRFASEDDPAWDATVAGSGMDLQVLVTGDATENVEWKVDLEIFESN